MGRGQVMEFVLGEISPRRPRDVAERDPGQEMEYEDGWLSFCRWPKYSSWEVVQEAGFWWFSLHRRFLRVGR